MMENGTSSSSSSSAVRDPEADENVSADIPSVSSKSSLNVDDEEVVVDDEDEEKCHSVITGVVQTHNRDRRRASGTTESIMSTDNPTTTTTNHQQHPLSGMSKSSPQENGKVFLTTKTTLCRDSNSFFYRLIQDDPELPTDKDDNGGYMIDRDGDYFAPVLNYLRHGRLVVDKHVSIQGIMEEAEFYNLSGLIGLCKERMSSLEGASSHQTKHVYRVIQCQEDELTNVVSAMSDGWRFEQLLHTGSLYHYHNEEHGEYLCVVSKECPEAGIATLADGSTCDSAKVLQMKGRRN